MSITITDPALLAQLVRASGVVELKGPDGRVLGRFLGGGRDEPPPGVKSPISDEQFEAARNQPDGLPLADVWKRIRERHGP